MTWIRISLDYVRLIGKFTKIVMFNFETIIFYAPLGSVYTLLVYILGNIEKENRFIYNICNKSTWD